MYLGAEVGTEGGRGHGGLSLTTKHRYSAFTSFFSRSYFGTNNGQVEVGVKRQLDKNLSDTLAPTHPSATTRTLSLHLRAASQSLVYNARLNFIDMHLTMTRNLMLPWGTPVKGFVTGIFGAYYGLKVSPFPSLPFHSEAHFPRLASRRTSVTRAGAWVQRSGVPT